MLVAEPRQEKNGRDTLCFLLSSVQEARGGEEGVGQGGSRGGRGQRDSSVWEGEAAHQPTASWAPQQGHSPRDLALRLTSLGGPHRGWG